MSVQDIFLKWIFPILGGFVASLLFVAPMKAVLKARRERVLGELNPLPFPAQTANAAGWIAYSIVIVPKNRNGAVFIYWANQIGLVLGLFFTLSCYGLANTKTRDRQLAIILFFSLIIPLIGTIGVLLEMSQHDLQLLWGFTANAILLLFYAAPLSTIVTVIRTRSAASLNLPLAVMQIINGGMWLGYGLAVSDPFIWVPNGIGAITGTILCSLLFIFRKRKTSITKHQSPAPSESDTVASSQQCLNLAVGHECTEFNSSYVSSGGGIVDRARPPGDSLMNHSTPGMNGGAEEP